MSGKRRLILLSVLASVFAGVFLGSGAYTFVSANGTSYLSNNPEVCVNCHIMRTEYDSWRHGSHHAVAVCNDCHLPHSNVVSKLYVKASNGYHHSKAFTLLNFAEPIRIKPGNAQVLEDNCLRCHGELTSEITAHGTLGVPTDPTRKADLYGCVRCHQEVGHGPMG
ncbi:cytochrome c nitrite reductase small subunit [Geothrix edaphica]|uniref:Cytochrome c nitrite reductase small subunit n=1 Tax=Geothrix edaphica TaxID=2927976 RepID=A0ABQ5PTK9_9BACT|nr:cytochrome c nitrite reductase small subunit [Geothrix edaphica]GLH65827.1 cytochrome c nitrite reductase small subunit [Geothrix edaphica]